MYLPIIKKYSFHFIPPGKLRGKNIMPVMFDTNTKQVFAEDKLIGSGFIEQQVIIIQKPNKG